MKMRSPKPLSAEQSSELVIRLPRLVTNPAAMAELNRRLIEKYLSYLEMQGSPRNTVITYGHALRSFAAFLKGRCVGILGVQHSDLLLYLATFEARGLSKQTQALHVHAFRNFQKFIRLVGLPCSRAFRRIQLPKKPRRVAQAHSIPEIEALIAAARTPFERAFVELGFATGCRISELQRMRAEEINWANRSLRVIGKVGKERVVFFGAPAEKAVRALLRGRTEGFLFRQEHTVSLGTAKPNKTGPTVYYRCWWTELDRKTGSRMFRCRWIGNVKKMKRAQARRIVEELNRDLGSTAQTVDRPESIRNLCRIFSRIGVRAGMKTWPHLLRHSFATALMNHGAPLRELQELLGHTALSTTAVYLHAAPEDLVRVHQRFHPRNQNQENELEEKS
jgi:site-specific recombinase XerD